MTYLEIVNNILVRLRETQVSSVTDTPYSTLIGVMVNDAKREIEDAHKWEALRTTVVIPSVSGTTDYSITGSGQRFKEDMVINDTANTPMQKASRDWILTQRYTVDVEPSGIPYYYAYHGVDTNGDSKITVFPKPDGVYSMRVSLFVPQADLTSNADVIKVPGHLLQLLGYAKAISERGEDGGTSFNEVYQQYRLALADAISIEAEHHDEQLVWSEV